jgi:transposase
VTLVPPAYVRPYVRRNKTDRADAEAALTVRERRGHNKATIAVANKLGRIVWAVWTKDVPFAVANAA